MYFYTKVVQKIVTFLPKNFANIFHLKYLSLLQCSKYQHFRTDCFNICTSPGFPPRIFKWCLPVLNKVLTCTLHFKLCPEQPSSWYNTSWIPRGHCSIRLDCNYHVNILCSDMQICTHANCIIPSSPWNVDLCSMFWEFLMKQNIKLSLTEKNHNYLTLVRKAYDLLFCPVYWVIVTGQFVIFWIQSDKMVTTYILFTSLSSCHCVSR